MAGLLFACDSVRNSSPLAGRRAFRPLRSGRLEKPRLANLPFMVLAADRAARADAVAADAEQGVQFAIDADVDVLSGVRADEMQPFHGGLRMTTPVGADCLDA